MKSGLSLCRIHSVAFLTTCAPYVSVRWCSAPQTAAGQFAAIPQDCHLFPRIFQALPTVLPGRPLLISKVDRECSYCLTPGTSVVHRRPLLTPEPPRPGELRGFCGFVVGHIAKSWRTPIAKDLSERCSLPELTASETAPFTAFHGSDALRSLLLILWLSSPGKTRRTTSAL